MSSADKSVVSGVLWSETSRAASRTSSDGNLMSDSNFVQKKYHVVLTGTFFMHVQKKCWSEEKWIKLHNPIGFVGFFPRRYFLFFFFFLDIFHKITLGPPVIPSPKPLTKLFFSSNSHHAKEQSQTLETGVNPPNDSRATTHSPAPN